MTIKTSRKLRLRALARIHGVELKPTDPVCIYSVEGTSNGELIQIENQCASGREPIWQIHYINGHRYVGAYKTPDEALDAVQEGLMLCSNCEHPKSSHILNRAEAGRNCSELAIKTPQPVTSNKVLLCTCQDFTEVA
jgi:hypothetical protein